MEKLLPILNGYCTIQLYQKVGGSNRHSHTIKWELCGNTLVDQCNFNGLDKYRWLMQRVYGTQDCYAYRKERLPNGGYVAVIMAREILGLPSGAGCGGDQGDHKDHDTLNNTLDNLRVATLSQSDANRRKHGVQSRFKGVSSNGSGFHARIMYDDQRIHFLTLLMENEAGFMYRHASIKLLGEFSCVDEIPPDEMPSEERQEELKQMVEKKLREMGLLI